MVEFITLVYFFYIFVSLYMLTLFFMIYFPNRRHFFDYPKGKKKHSLDIVIPCYNEEKNIGGTIKALLNSDYENLRKIIVVDDCSTDNSHKIIKEIAKKNPKVILVKTPKNTGKASGAKNYGVRFSDADLIGFSDADSYSKKDAVRKMIGFFDDEKVGAATSAIFVKNSRKWIEMLQSIEYRIIVFTRKLLGFVDAIYVTPGPLSIYRKKIFDEVGGFDENNMTEDIEITWHIASKGYHVRMNPLSRVFTVVPDTYRGWLRQRIRWNVGGLQTINKYKKTFLKKGMLGSFILPFFVFSWLIGISGIFILAYRAIRTFLLKTLSTTYLIGTESRILMLEDINLVPSILIIFGITVILLSLAFTLTALYHTKEAGFKKKRLLKVPIYMFVYVMTYPLILVMSIFRALKKSHSW